MTAPATVYPRSVDELMPDAEALTMRLGEVPSRNRLKKELRIGGAKAEAVRDRLVQVESAWRAESTEPVRPGEIGGPVQLTRLPEPRKPVEPRTPAEPRRPADPHRAAESTSVAGPTGSAKPIGLAGLAVPPKPAPLAGPTTLADPTALTEPAKTVGGPDVEAPEQVAAATVDPVPVAAPARARPVAVWPIALLALPAFVALWAGWVDLGRLTGFGPVNLLPGFVEPGGWATIDSAITLPIGMETYAAYALYVWLSGRVPVRARRFAMWSAIVALIVGAAGQVAYHLLIESGQTSAPWQITTLVACLPVAVLGMGAALAHLVRDG